MDNGGEGVEGRSQCEKPFQNRSTLMGSHINFRKGRLKITRPHNFVKTIVDMLVY